MSSGTHDLLAVVVAFDPGPSLADLCAALLADGCDVLVVDNASASGLEVLRDCRDAGADVVRMPVNAGVSGALAVGHARAADRQWLLTFDQDSVVESGLVRALHSSRATEDPRVALVGPLVRDAARDTLLQGVVGRTGSYPVPLVITSGALCRVEALDDVGGFREDLFIDLVDYDLCLRLRRRGWTVAVESSAVMRHSIGATREHPLGGRLRVTNTHHSADRQYYKYRNYVLLLRDGAGRVDRRWALRSAAALAWGPLKVLAFEQDRAAKVGAMAAGVRDGLRGAAGPRPPRP